MIFIEKNKQVDFARRTVMEKYNTFNPIVWNQIS